MEKKHCVLGVSYAYHEIITLIDSLRERGFSDETLLSCLSIADYTIRREREVEIRIVK